MSSTARYNIILTAQHVERELTQYLEQVMPADNTTRGLRDCLRTALAAPLVEQTPPSETREGDPTVVRLQRTIGPDGEHIIHEAAQESAPTRASATRERLIAETTAIGMLGLIESAHTISSTYREAARDAIKAFEELAADRDEWREQHENLLAMYHKAIAAPLTAPAEAQPVARNVEEAAHAWFDGNYHDQPRAKRIALWTPYYVGFSDGYALASRDALAPAQREVEGIKK